MRNVWLRRLNEINGSYECGMLSRKINGFFENVQCLFTIVFQRLGAICTLVSSIRCCTYYHVLYIVLLCGKNVERAKTSAHILDKIFFSPFSLERVYVSRNRVGFSKICMYVSQPSMLFREIRTLKITSDDSRDVGSAERSVEWMTTGHVAYCVEKMKPSRFVCRAYKQKLNFRLILRSIPNRDEKIDRELGGEHAAYTRGDGVQ